MQVECKREMQKNDVAEVGIYLVHLIHVQRIDRQFHVHKMYYFLFVSLSTLSTL